MNTSTRILGSLVLLASALLAVTWMQPACLSAVGVNWQSDRVAAAARAQSLEDMDARLLVVRKRLDAKEQITRRLMAGEIGLFEAAAWFGFLNDTPAKYPDLRWCTIPGRSDGEKLCRQVISWVSGTMSDRVPKSQRDNRLRQLEEELARHLAQFGTIDLADHAPVRD